MKHSLVQTIGSFLLLSATVAWADSYSVERSLPLSTSPDEAWNMIGDFCDVDDWHPDVKSCALKVIDGSLHRILVLGNGAEIIEKRIAVEPGLSYTYSIVSSPFPFEKYVATLSITRGSTPEITWSSRFKTDDPEMENAIAGIFENGLAAIEARLKE